MQDCYCVRALATDQILKTIEQNAEAIRRYRVKSLVVQRDTRGGPGALAS
jgi:hypothetical protein